MNRPSGENFGSLTLLPASKKRLGCPGPSMGIVQTPPSAQKARTLLTDQSEGSTGPALVGPKNRGGAFPSMSSSAMVFGASARFAPTTSLFPSGLHTGSEKSPF